MEIVVSLLVLVAIAAVAWVVVDVVRRVFRGARVAPGSARRAAASLPTPPSFGALPPIGPVGALGEVAPDADIGSSATDEHDIYGE